MVQKERERCVYNQVLPRGITEKSAETRKKEKNTNERHGQKEMKKGNTKIPTYEVGHRCGSMTNNKTNRQPRRRELGHKDRVEEGRLVALPS
jgi:hypothetical protein